MLKVLREVRVRFPSGVPLLEPLQDIKVSDERGKCHPPARSQALGHRRLEVRPLDNA